MKTMEELVANLKHLGYVYQGSEIYGGLANAWDYGPLGVELKNNIKRFWWKKFVQEAPTNVGLDSAILMNPSVWVASGHVGSFSDPLIDCKGCGARHRADKLIEEATHGEVTADGWSDKALDEYILDHKVPCPICGKSNFTSIRKFNLMFKTIKESLKTRRMRCIYALKLRKEFSSTLKMFKEPLGRKSHLGLPKLVSPLEMKSPPGTLSLEPVSLNKWNWNSFVNQVLI
jgi:glycyl-tRNA synthetase